MTNPPPGAPPPPPYGQPARREPQPAPPGWGPGQGGQPWQPPQPPPPQQQPPPPPLQQPPPQQPPPPQPPPDGPGPGAGQPEQGGTGPGRDQGTVVGGLVVVGIGLFLLLMQFVPDAGRWIPLAIGIAFLAAFLVRREYGFLIPGAILGGIGVGILLADVVDEDLSAAVVVLSLAAGFLSIWVVSVLTGIPGRKPGEEDAASAAWWPLIPGGILALVGLVVLTDVDVGSVARWWPLIIVLVGLLILGRALAERRRGS